jgi:hypothetical protein
MKKEKGKNDAGVAASQAFFCAARRHLRWLKNA